MNIVCALTASEYADRGDASDNSKLVPVAACLNSGGKGGQRTMNVDTAVGVRRLTPTECERLQGFPEVENTVIIELCSDHLKTDAPAETSNPKLPLSACHADERSFNSHVRYVDYRSVPTHHDPEWPALADVHIFCGLERVELRNRAKLVWSASTAEERSSSRQPIDRADFALSLAGLISCVDQITQHGVEGLPLSEQCSIALRNGNLHVRLYGGEIMQRVGAARAGSIIQSKPTKSTTSSHSPIETIEHDLITSFCSVVAAISGCIPTETLPANSFKTEIIVRRGWTCLCSGVPCTCPDGHRYQAMGNAVSVPVIEWIGKRLKQQERSL